MAEIYCSAIRLRGWEEPFSDASHLPYVLHKCAVSLVLVHLRDH